MALFDSVGTFKAQFTPIEGGYLYYPSRRSGGKLVTQAEYEELLAGWQKFAGRRGRWLMLAAVTVAVIAWSFFSNGLRLPAWADSVFMGVLVVLFVGSKLWAAFAPRRLVIGRPDIVPPRTMAETKKAARALIRWRIVFFGLMIGVLVMLHGLDERPGWHQDGWFTLGTLLLCCYLWIALRKWLDVRQRI